LLMLAGCVPLQRPEPFARKHPPLALPQEYHIYLPLYVKPPPRVGIGMDWRYQSCDYPAQVGADWYYNWGYVMPSCRGVEGIPMIWSAVWGDEPILPTGTQHLLLFNECDLRGQCNASPELAARAWYHYERLYPGVKLVGPNTSHLGWQWLLDWHAAYVRLYGKPPRIWALGIHCYMPPAECQAWVDRNAALAREWTESGKVWLTEWAMTGCYYPQMERAAAETQALSDADEFMGWILDNPDVEREAWFVARLRQPRACSTDLIAADGSLTELGEWHREAVQSGMWQ
jgi:hypothetical protein